MRAGFRDVRELILGVVEEGGLTTRYRYDNATQSGFLGKRQR